MKLVIVQIADNCSYGLHTSAKAFAQINKKFKSDVNDKLISEIWTYCFGGKKLIRELSQSNWEKLK